MSRTKKSKHGRKQKEEKRKALLEEQAMREQPAFIMPMDNSEVQDKKESSFFQKIKADKDATTPSVNHELDSSPVRATPTPAARKMHENNHTSVTPQTAIKGREDAAANTNRESNSTAKNLKAVDYSMDREMNKSTTGSAKKISAPIDPSNNAAVTAARHGANRLKARGHREFSSYSPNSLTDLQKEARKTTKPISGHGQGKYNDEAQSGSIRDSKNAIEQEKPDKEGKRFRKERRKERQRKGAAERKAREEREGARSQGEKESANMIPLVDRAMLSKAVSQLPAAVLKPKNEHKRKIESEHDTEEDDDLDKKVIKKFKSEQNIGADPRAQTQNDYISTVGDSMLKQANIRESVTAQTVKQDMKASALKEDDEHNSRFVSDQASTTFSASSQNRPATNFNCEIDIEPKFGYDASSAISIETDTEVETDAGSQPVEYSSSSDNEKQDIRSVSGSDSAYDYGSSLSNQDTDSDSDADADEPLVTRIDTAKIASSNAASTQAIPFRSAPSNSISSQKDYRPSSEELKAFTKLHRLIPEQFLQTSKEKKASHSKTTSGMQNGEVTTEYQNNGADSGIFNSLYATNCADRIVMLDAAHDLIAALSSSTLAQSLGLDKLTPKAQRMKKSLLEQHGASTVQNSFAIGDTKVMEKELARIAKDTHERVRDLEAEVEMWKSQAEKE